MSNLQPQKGDKLIKSPTNDDNLAIVGRMNEHLSQHLQIEGYYKAAISLVKSAINAQSNSDKDGLIYSALFCFRHYLELTMKDTIRNFSSEHIEGHSLSNLWETLKPLFDYDPANNMCNATDKLIDEIHQIDENSTTFRYIYNSKRAAKQSGTPLTSGKEIRVDMQNLKTVMEKMYNFFDKISAQSQK